MFSFECGATLITQLIAIIPIFRNQPSHFRQMARPHFFSSNLHRLRKKAVASNHFKIRTNAASKSFFKD